MEINGIEIVFASDPKEARMRCLAFLESLSATASSNVSDDTGEPP